jgi:hypothetical protein
MIIRGVNQPNRGESQSVLLLVLRGGIRLSLHSPLTTDSSFKHGDLYDCSSFSSRAVLVEAFEERKQNKSESITGLNEPN